MSELHSKMVKMSQAWLYMPIIPAFRRLRQKDKMFEVSLGYKGIPCLKKKGGD
jgi:hypothetical protein